MHLVQKVKDQIHSNSSLCEQGRADERGQTELIMVQIESKIEFDLTFMENVLCVFGTTYWVLGRHNKYQKWFYRKCYNVIWFFIGWSRAIKCNLPMVFNTSCSKTPFFHPDRILELLYDKMTCIFWAILLSVFLGYSFILFLLSFWLLFCLLHWFRKLFWIFIKIW